jgi:hypothetical protein
VVALTVGLTAALAFGILVLARGDWIPGGIIVVAAIAGLARQVPAIRKLHREQPRSS